MFLPYLYSTTLILLFPSVLLFDVGFQLSYIVLFPSLAIATTLAPVWKPKAKPQNIFGESSLFPLLHTGTMP
jgi:Sec-independent protein secretion pathway component TatC